MYWLLLSAHFVFHYVQTLLSGASSIIQCLTSRLMLMTLFEHWLTYSDAKWIEAWIILEGTNYMVSHFHHPAFFSFYLTSSFTVHAIGASWYSHQNAFTVSMQPSLPWTLGLAQRNILHDGWELGTDSVCQPRSWMMCKFIQNTAYYGIS